MFWRLWVWMPTDAIAIRGQKSREQIIHILWVGEMEYSLSPVNQSDTGKLWACLWSHVYWRALSTECFTALWCSNSSSSKTWSWLVSCVSSLSPIGCSYNRVELIGGWELTGENGYDLGWWWVYKIRNEQMFFLLFAIFRQPCRKPSIHSKEKQNNENWCPCVGQVHSAAVHCEIRQIGAGIKQSIIFTLSFSDCRTSAVLQF